MRVVGERRWWRRDEFRSESCVLVAAAGVASTTVRSSLEALLANGRVLLADGATGTNYFQMGLEAGGLPELWNVEHPERVQELHRAFVDAGADLILTNTFGGNRHRLKLHRAEDRVVELNQRAAELAREVADAAPRPVVVAGSVGPTGELFAPLGALTDDEARAAFTEQIAGLADGGADVAWIETMSSGAPGEQQVGALGDLVGQTVVEVVVHLGDEGVVGEAREIDLSGIVRHDGRA
jgi:methionine synthase I (cobalamin-dependent)